MCCYTDESELISNLYSTSGRTGTGFEETRSNLEYNFARLYKSFEGQKNWLLSTGTRIFKSQSSSGFKQPD